MSNCFSKMRTKISQPLHHFIYFRLNELLPLLQIFNLLILKLDPLMVEKSDSDFGRGGTRVIFKLVSGSAVPHRHAGRQGSKRRCKFAVEAYLADMMSTPCIMRLVVRVLAEPERGSPANAVLKLLMCIVHHAATRSVFPSPWFQDCEDQLNYSAILQGIPQTRAF
jgi:hypothetical protein